MKTSLQSFGIEGASVFAALHAQCFEPGWSQADMAELVGSPGVTGLVVERDGAPAGMVLVRAAAGEAEILTIAVLPQARRSGLGARLMAAAAEAAREHACDTLFLEVSDRNAAAAALYAGAGFEEVGRRRGYYRDGSDARLLSLRL
jgi:ribosomal-protein-alanine N-acetyltransferase